MLSTSQKTKTKQSQSSATLQFNMNYSNSDDIYDAGSLSNTEDAVISYDDVFRFYKNCKHTVTKTELRPKPSVATLTNGIPENEHWNKTYYSNGLTILASAKNPNTNRTMPETPSWFNMSSSLTDSVSLMLNRALDDLMPTVSDLSGGFSLANFVAELRDVKSMFKLFDKSLSAVKNFSAGVLNWNFAWKPTIQDVQSIYKGLGRMQESIDKWNNQAKTGVILTRHWSGANFIDEPMAQDELVHTSFEKPFSGQSNVWKLSSEFSKTEEFRVTLSFKPKRISVDGLDKVMWYFDYYGLGQGMSIPWNGLMLSFVVDWVLTVGDFLKQFEQDTFVYPIEIVDLGYSHKIENKRTYRDLGATFGGVTFLHPGGEEIYTEKSYTRRRVTVPAENEGIDWGLLRLKLPSVRQCWLGLNLANVLRR